ncbi:MAG: ribosome-associated translation inhibitor RaiA [Verrucomicrobia bacterium]|nr:ribosome-associated translation inhibitor RaiA [Verrucomicrobiota bacterium]
MGKTTKFDNQGYNISVVGKHFQITDAINNYVFEKMNKVERIADQIIDVIATLDAQKMAFTCSIMMNFVHFHVKVSASTDNMYSAIDKATDRLITLIRKYKTKLQSRRFRDLTTVDIHVNVIKPLSDDLKAINEDIEAENARIESEKYNLHQVVAKDTMKLKTLTQDEAIVKMEISDEPFLIFRSEEDQKMKVIYRRPDQNYGIVQIQS